METLSDTLYDQTKFWQLFARQYAENYPGIDDTADTQWRMQVAVERARRTLEDAHRCGKRSADLLEVNLYEKGVTFRSPDEPQARWLTAELYIQHEKEEKRDGKFKVVTYKAKLLDRQSWTRLSRSLQQCFEHLGLSYRRTTRWARYRTYELDLNYIAPWLMPPKENKHWAKQPALQVKLGKGPALCFC